MADVREWLPKEAFTEAAVRAVLSNPIARWCERWISARSIVVQSVRRLPEKERGAAVGQGMRAAGALADVELSGRGKRVLLEVMLDVDLAAHSLTENDHKLLDALAERAIADLSGILDETFSGVNENRGTLFEANVAFSGSAEFATLHFFDTAIVRLVKAQLGKGRAQGSAPSGRLAALKTVKVTAEGILGQAELALDDVPNIAVGDVVMLDRLLQEPVDLRISESGRRLGSGKLCQSDGRISIQL